MDLNLRQQASYPESIFFLHIVDVDIKYAE